MKWWNGQIKGSDFKSVYITMDKALFRSVPLTHWTSTQGGFCATIRTRDVFYGEWMNWICTEKNSQRSCCLARIRGITNRSSQSQDVQLTTTMLYLNTKTSVSNPGIIISSSLRLIVFTCIVLMLALIPGPSVSFNPITRRRPKHGSHHLKHILVIGFDLKPFCSHINNQDTLIQEFTIF